MPTTRVVLHSLSRANAAHRRIADQSVSLLERIVNSEAFAQTVLNEEYTSALIRREGDRYEQTTNDELLETIKTGREWGTAPDHEIALHVTLTRYRREVGSVDYPGALLIDTSTWYVNQCIRYSNPAALAAHWLHEWLHVAGYAHGDHAERDVNYGTGLIVERLGSADKEAFAERPPALYSVAYAMQYAVAEEDKSAVDDGPATQ